MYNYSKMAVSN